MALISITRLRVRSWRFLPAFYLRAYQSTRQARAAEGNLDVALLADRSNTFWTATSWTSESAMKAFMISGAHRPAMKSLLEWCDEASLVHWTQDDSVGLPSWGEAHRRLQAEGRRSKVNHPSPAHVAFEIAAPRGARN
jgi:hypothetical protein